MLQHKAAEGGLGTLGVLSSHTKGCPQLTNHSLWRTHNQPFLRHAEDKILSSEHKLQSLKYPVDVKKQCFTMRAPDQGLRWCVKFSSLQMLCV